MAYTFKHGDRILESYTVQRAVGRGGFGEVYYAISDGGREVALKYLCDNPQVELRGVSHCINLKSPHLVSIFDVKKTDEDDYSIIMEYCSGPSLRDLLIAEPDGFAPEKAVFFVREIAKGLSYLHDRGIVHRDLKPGNIFYDDGYVKIGDYGLAKIISVSRHSAQTASVGTVHYMAPEIGSGNYSRGVDIYALGVMLYEMLLGTVPFEGSTMAEVLMKHLTSQPELDNLPAPFGKVIRKALAKDPGDRYQTVDEMVEELLDAEDIKESVAGFSPKSLQSAVRQAGAHEQASPMPSPNPPPRSPQQDLPPFALPMGARTHLSGKAKKRLDRIARKVERRRTKLAGSKPRPAQTSPHPQPGAMHDHDGPPRSIRRRRFALMVFLTAVLSVGLGVTVAQTTHHEEVGIMAGLLIPMMAVAVVLGRKATRWFAIEDGPGWARSLVRGGFAVPFLAVACAPVLDRFGDEGVAVWVAMIAAAMFLGWDKTIDESQDGDVSLGRAISTGFGGLVIYAIAGALIGHGPEEDFMLAAAGSVCLTSLIIQASTLGGSARGWSRPNQARDRDDNRGDPEAGGHARAAASFAQVAGPPPVPDAQRGQAAQLASHGPERSDAPARRWAVTRVFWTLAAVTAMLVSLATFVLSLAAFNGANDYHDCTFAIIVCVSALPASLFAWSKTTAFRRNGFWRETVNPFLITLSLAVIGGTITAIAREWGHATAHRTSCIGDEGAAMVITVLVLSSLLFVVLTLLTGWDRHARSASFLTGRGPRGDSPRSSLTSEATAIGAGAGCSVAPPGSDE